MLIKNYSRRIILRGFIALGWTLFFPVSSIAQSGKASKKELEYQNKPKGDQKCDNCMHFISPNACMVVEGDISPEGWCKLWHKKSA